MKKCVWISAVVSFFIIAPFMIAFGFFVIDGKNLEFSMVTTIVSVFAVVFAAFSAFFAGCAIYEDKRWRKLNRTYAHSPYRNESLLNAIKELRKNFTEMEMTQKEFWEELKKNESKKQVDRKLKKEEVDLVVHVANLWGQMASEYYDDLLDEKAARNIMRYNFLKFCFVFEKWLSHEDRCDIYENTLKLYEEWKKD